MTNLGIVGHEAAKFTPETEALARQAIRELFAMHLPTMVISGACPLGGIDRWAIEEAKAVGLQTREFAPEVNAWNPPGRYGFKARNEDIADASQHVACIVVCELPHGYRGLQFNKCYHCAKHGPHAYHVKSGGCWTAWRCRSREWVII